MLRSLLIGALLTGAACNLAAQSTSHVRVGERVRIETADGRRGVYVVDSMDSDRLLVSDPLQRTTRSVDPLAIRKIERSGGMRTRSEGFARSGGLALVGGALAGGMLGFAVGDSSCEDKFVCVRKPEAALLLGGVFGVTAGAIGGLIGLANPGERWEKTQLPQHVSVAPSADGGAILRVSLTF